MNIEEKAKRYDEAIKRAKDFIKGEVHYALRKGENIMCWVFPELKESEGEKIRKALITFFQRFPYENIDAAGTNAKEAIAWLEKQGGITKLSEEEQNRFAKGVLTRCAMSFVNYLDAHKYEGKMCVSNGECEDIENAFHNDMWDRLHRYYCKYIEKQGEQKPAWSEEDESNLDSAIYYIRREPYRANDVEPIVNWLRAIKDRYTWKPSDEQMKALKEACDEHWEPDGLDPLYMLWEQLKKLREE
jgi:hypothetical protein